MVQDLKAVRSTVRSCLSLKNCKKSSLSLLSSSSDSFKRSSKMSSFRTSGVVGGGLTTLKLTLVAHSSLAFVFVLAAASVLMHATSSLASLALVFVVETSAGN
jgi:hypothetical protein